MSDAGLAKSDSELTCLLTLKNRAFGVEQMEAEISGNRKQFFVNRTKMPL